MNESNDFIGSDGNDEFAFIDDFTEEPEEDEMPTDLPTETVKRIEEAMGRMTPEFVRNQLRKTLNAHGLELQDDPVGGTADAQLFDQQVSDLISTSGAWQRAIELVNAARKEHDAIIKQADAKAQEILDAAHHNAAQIEDEALSTARRMVQAAEKRVDQILQRLRLLPQQPTLPELQITCDFSPMMPRWLRLAPSTHLLTPMTTVCLDGFVSPPTASGEVIVLSNCSSRLEEPALAQAERLALPRLPAMFLDEEPHPTIVSQAFPAGSYWAQLHADLPMVVDLPNLSRLVDMSRLAKMSAAFETYNSMLRLLAQANSPTGSAHPAASATRPGIKAIKNRLSRHWKAAGAQMRALRKID